jgi:4-hydroxyphenylacetate decarboxylase small subunit
MDYNCQDCRFFLPVDVFRGLCKLTKTELNPDDASCKKFECLPKCKFCSHYSIEKDFLGKCKKTVLTSPDLNASKCTDFKWSQLN